MLELLLFGPAIDADALEHRRVVRSLGGAYSDVRLARNSALIKGLKACGAWWLYNDLAWYAADNSVQALVTLKMRLTQVAVSGPTHVASRGFLGNLAGAINSQWSPLGNGSPLFVRDSARYAFHVYSVATTGYHMGFSDNLYSETYWGGATWIYGVNGAAAFDSFAHNGNKTGLISVQRTGASVQSAHQNGVLMGTGTAVSAATENMNAFILGSTQNGTTARAPTDAGLSFALWGAPMTDAQHAAEYAVIRAALNREGAP